MAFSSCFCPTGPGGTWATRPSGTCIASKVPPLSRRATLSQVPDLFLSTWVCDVCSPFLSLHGSFPAASGSLSISLFGVPPNLLWPDVASDPAPDGFILMSLSCPTSQGGWFWLAWSIFPGQTPSQVADQPCGWSALLTHGLMPWFHRGGDCSGVHREGRRIRWRGQHDRTREGSVSRESEPAGVSTGSCPKEVSFEDRKDQGSVPTVLQLKKKSRWKNKTKTTKKIKESTERISRWDEKGWVMQGQLEMNLTRGHWHLERLSHLIKFEVSLLVLNVRNEAPRPSW